MIKRILDSPGYILIPHRKKIIIFNYEMVKNGNSLHDMLFTFSSSSNKTLALSVNWSLNKAAATVSVVKREINKLSRALNTAEVSENAMWCWNNEWLREITGTYGIAGQFHRERWSKGASRKVLNCQIWKSSDESHSQAAGRWDVVVRWTTKTFRSTGESRKFNMPTISELLVSQHMSWETLIRFISEHGKLLFYMHKIAKKNSKQSQLVERECRRKINIFVCGKFYSHLNFSSRP